MSLNGMLSERSLGCLLLFLSTYLWRQFVQQEIREKPDVFHWVGGQYRFGPTIVAYLLFPLITAANFVGVITPMRLLFNSPTTAGVALVVVMLSTMKTVPVHKHSVRQGIVLVSSGLSCALAFETGFRTMPELLISQPLIVPLWMCAITCAAGAWAADSSHSEMELVRTVSSATTRSDAISGAMREGILFESTGFGAGWSVTGSMKKQQFQLPQKLFAKTGRSPREIEVLSKLLHPENKQVPREIYSWHPKTTKLIPLLTHGDGNCLLHAASNAVIGIGDDLSSARLRTAVLDAMQDQTLKAKIWPAFRASRCLVEGLHIEMDEAQLEAEWDTLVRNAACFDTQSAEFLEDVHLLVLSHVFRRPIIVYGATMVDPHRRELWVTNHMRGLFLPYFYEPSRCHTSPLCLLYYPSHFVALVPVESTTSTEPLLVSISEVNSADLLPVKLLGNRDAMTTAAAYMHVKAFDDGLLAVIEPTAETGYYRDLASIYLKAHGL